MTANVRNEWLIAILILTLSAAAQAEIIIDTVPVGNQTANRNSWS